MHLACLEMQPIYCPLESKKFLFGMIHFQLISVKVGANIQNPELELLYQQ